MARTGNGTSPRFNLTLSEEEASLLEEYARTVERRPTTAARELLLAGLAAASGDGDLAGLQRRYEEVQRERDNLHRQLAAAFHAQRPSHGEVMPAALPPAGPVADRRSRRRRRLARWEWPIEDLVADSGWWDRWLPRLYELLSRDLRHENEYGCPTGKPIVDSRGYGDLLTYLFPPARGVTWRSPDYPRAAAEEDRQSGQDDRSPSVRAQVWNPVLRHVAKALRALEDTSAASTDPQLRLEAEARITGSWVLVLGNLVGHRQTARLPHPIR
jgi:hypothetical protein